MRRFVAAAALIAVLPAIAGAAPEVERVREPQDSGAVDGRPQYVAARPLEPVPVRARPRRGSRVLARVAPRTEFDSIRLMPVRRTRGPWMEVSDAALGNGRWGWIRSRDVVVYPADWRVDASLSRREVVVRRAGQVQQRFPVAIGRPGSPTPTGRFAVTDKLRTGNPSSPYGCCVLALSGRQPSVPQGWGGGDRIAIHATTATYTIGTAASAGCLRAPADEAALAMRTIPTGTPVWIRP